MEGSNLPLAVLELLMEKLASSRSFGTLARAVGASSAMHAAGLPVLLKNVDLTAVDLSKVLSSSLVEGTASTGQLVRRLALPDLEASSVSIPFDLFAFGSLEALSVRLESGTSSASFFEALRAMDRAPRRLVFDLVGQEACDAVATGFPASVQTVEFAFRYVVDARPAMLALECAPNLRAWSISTPWIKEMVRLEDHPRIRKLLSRLSVPADDLPWLAVFACPDGRIAGLEVIGDMTHGLWLALSVMDGLEELVVEFSCPAGKAEIGPFPRGLKKLTLILPNEAVEDDSKSLKKLLAVDGGLGLAGIAVNVTRREE